MLDKILSRLDVEHLLTKLVESLPDFFAAVIVMMTFWLAYRVSRGPLNAMFRRAGFHETLVRMLVNNVYKLTLLLFGLIMAADQIGINVAAALAGLGVAGIAIGFAAQDSLANTIAGFIIFWDKPFEVDDWVTVAGSYGRVTHITMRSTRIRTNSNTYVVIPNKSIIDQVLINHSQHGEIRIEIPIGIAYKENIPQAREVILGAVKDLSGVIKHPVPDVVVNELGGSSVDLLVRVWISEAAEEQTVFFRTLEASKLALDAAGIQIPYPHLQLFWDDVEDRVVDKLERLPGLGRPA